MVQLKQITKFKNSTNEQEDVLNFKNETQLMKFLNIKTPLATAQVLHLKKHKKLTLETDEAFFDLEVVFK